MKVGVIGFGLFVKDFIEHLDELIIATCLFVESEINLFFESLRRFDFDDFILSFEGFFDKIQCHLESFLHELSLVVGQV